jgi:DTW domain-containing protein YfiP
MTDEMRTPGIARGPINYALQTCPEGYCPECSEPDDECECVRLPKPPARTPVQAEALLARQINTERKVAESMAYWAARR